MCFCQSICVYVSLSVSFSLCPFWVTVWVVFSSSFLSDAITGRMVMGGLTSECHAFMRQTHHSRSDGNNNGTTRSSLHSIRYFHAKDSIRRQSRHSTYTDFYQINVALARVPSFALLCFINTCATVFRRSGLCTHKKLLGATLGFQSDWIAVNLITYAIASGAYRVSLSSWRQRQDRQQHTDAKGPDFKYQMAPCALQCADTNTIYIIYTRHQLGYTHLKMCGLCAVCCGCWICASESVVRMCVFGVVAIDT